MPLKPPAGEKISTSRGSLYVPDHPIVPYVEGDGTGRDIWRASQRVFDAAVEKAFGGKRTIAWFEVLAVEKAFNKTKEWMPAETLTAFREYLVGIKGPLTTPVGGGIRSLNVAMRQELDLYVCLRPVRYFKGVPSPVKRPEDVDMVLFRENTEDIYAGVEWAAGTPEAQKVIAWLQSEMKVKKIRFPETSAIGIKPISQQGTERLVRAALKHALEAKRKSLTLVHKGNIMKSTEGGFRDWGYALATRELRGQVGTERESWILGDCLADALADQVGGSGIAPGGNINYETGHAIFEATHGTAPKYADLDKVNPGSVILSGCMMVEYMGWGEAATRIESALEKTIGQKRV